MWLPIWIEADAEIGDVITPIFITCDPQRDTVAEVNEYVKGNSTRTQLNSTRYDLVDSSQTNRTTKEYQSNTPTSPISYQNPFPHTDFHKDLIGLTGTLEEIARVAKSYRVYFSKPPKVNPGEDYLVDHSIFFYLMAPDGSFVDCYAKDHTAEFVSQSVKDHIRKFKEQGGKILAKLPEARIAQTASASSA